MNARRTAVLPLLCLAAALAAQDYGLELGSSAGISRTADISVSGAVTPSAWLTAPLGARSRIALRLNFSWRFSSDEAVAAGFPSFPYMFDPVELRFSSRFSDAEAGLTGLGLSLGRFTWRDPTGYVFSHRLDGIVLDGRYRIGSFELLAGYTGLLWSGSSGAYMSLADNSASLSEVFGPPRFIGAAVVRSPELAGHSLYLSALAQEDLRDPDTLTAEGETVYGLVTGGTLDTQYLSAGFTGSLWEPLAYGAFFTLNTGRVLSYLIASDAETGEYRYMPVAGLLTGLTAHFTPGWPLEPVFGLRFLYGSGDADAIEFTEGNTSGSFTTFKPVTGTGTGLVFSPSLGNICLFDLSAAAVPFGGTGSRTLRSLRVSGKALVFLRSGAGPVSEPGIKADAASSYLGTELDLTANMKILSDLSAGFSFGVFLPGAEPAGAFDPSCGAPQFSGRLSVLFSM